MNEQTKSRMRSAAAAAMIGGALIGTGLATAGTAAAATAHSSALVNVTPARVVGQFEFAGL